MLFAAASCGFPVIEGFLVFPRVRIRVKVRVRVREALSYGALSYVALSYGGPWLWQPLGMTGRNRRGWYKIYCTLQLHYLAKCECSTTPCPGKKVYGLLCITVTNLSIFS